MKLVHLLFLFTIAASQVGLAKSDDVLNKDSASLIKQEDAGREL